MPKIAFIYIAEPYQCYHAASVASSLANNPQCEVIEYINFPQTRFHLKCIRQALNAPDLPIRIFRKSLKTKILGYTRLLDHERIAVLQENLAELNTYDAIVATEYTAGLLKKIGLKKPKLILLMHGAGDRLVNDESLVRYFDFILVPGKKIEDYFLKKGLIKENNYKTIGYPKFDLFSANRTTKFQTAGGKEFALYNPHYNRTLKTYPTCMNTLISGFEKQDQYNLVISPHIKIFENGTGLYKYHIRRKNSAKVLVDTGSTAMLDMTYTRNASIYIGDGSSQVYEFLINPRPCIFLNPRKLQWRGNPYFLHWTLGDVVEDPKEMMTAVANATERHVLYKPLQEELFLKTFGSPLFGASQRGADAILEYISKRL